MNNFGNAKENLLVSQKQTNKYYDEKIDIDINNENDSHAIIAKGIKEKSICLDVGCGPGYIGELLKNEKNCTVYGIEIEKKAIQIAKNKNCYQELYNFSVTDSKKKEYQQFFKNPLKFDYIIFADILEHIENPGELLYCFSKKLKKDGKFLISIPNIAHMDISKHLIDRQFNYNTTGLLDNTHLRFFTKSSFAQMLDKINEYYDLNLHIKEIHKTIVVPSYASKYPNLYSILNKDQELCVLQYIYEIEKSKERIQNAIFKPPRNYQTIEKKLNEGMQLLEEIKQARSQTEYLNEQINQQKMQIEKHQQELSEILNSKSWKITAPLRKVMKLFSKKG